MCMPRVQSGSSLIESMIALLILALGMLGVVALQANAIRFSSDSVYRAQAAVSASSFIEAARSAGPGALPLYTGPEGARFVSWKNALASTLPGADLYPPEAAVLPNGDFRVSVRWKLPDEKTPHSYVLRTRL